MAYCICGWRGTTHSHRGDAFGEAHVHTRHVNTTVIEPDETAPPEHRDLDAANNAPGQLILLRKQPPHSDPRAARRVW